MKPILSILFAVAVGTLFAEKMPFARYQSIIDRMPFGAPPPGFNPEQMASEVSRSDAAGDGVELTQEQAQLQKSVSFSVINADPDDGSTMIGFTDLSDPKIPRHYYMRVGTSRDGWTVKAADLAKRTMTVEKDGVEVTLELGGNSSGDAAASDKGKNVSRLASRGGGNGSVGGQRSGLLSSRGPGQLSSFQGRRARREQAEAQEKANAEAQAAERKRQAEENAAKEEQARLEREREREEQRDQLKAIQDELRRVREEKERAAAESARESGGEEGGDEDDES